LASYGLEQIWRKKTNLSQENFEIHKEKGKKNKKNSKGKLYAAFVSKSGGRAMRTNMFLNGRAAGGRGG